MIYPDGDRIVRDYTSRKMTEYYSNLEAILLKAVAEGKNVSTIRIPWFNETWLEYTLKEEFIDFGINI